MADTIATTALDTRTMALAGELRCLVCQNQSLADSHAPLALDLRQQIHQQLEQGRSEQQVVDFMVQRYGDFVLYNPPVKSSTWLLWGGPFVLLIVGLAVLVAKLRKRDKQIPAAELTSQEHDAAAKLLAGEDKK